MQWKKVGVALSGALLLGSTLLGAAAADPADVDRSFFINEDDGEPVCLVVVGSGAAAEDVVSASWIAAEIGTMAYYEKEVIPDATGNSICYYEESEVDNYIAGTSLYEEAATETYRYFDDFRVHEGDYTVESTPESWVVLPYACPRLDFSVAAADINPPFLATIPDFDFDGNPTPTGGNPDSNGMYDNGIDKDDADVVQTPWWDYDLYIDHNTLFACAEDVLLDTGCSFEAVTVDFSIRDWVCTQNEVCAMCTSACDQMGLWFFDEDQENDFDVGEFLGNIEELIAEANADAEEGDPLYESFEDMLNGVEVVGGDNLQPMDILPYNSMLDECQTYPNVYQRHYFGTPSWDNEICDPIGGVQYRSIVYNYNTLDTIQWLAIVGPDSEAYEVCTPHCPQPVDLYCETCDVYFLGEHFDALAFGTNSAGVDYMFYGTPKWYVEEKLHVGESKEYDSGYSLSINDLGIYENKAEITITDPDGVENDYIVVINTYTSQTPSDGDGCGCWYDLNEDGIVDCGEVGVWYDANGNCIVEDGEINTETVGNEENDTIAFVEETCGSENVVFAVKFIKTMIGASGSYVIEYHAYELDDYGCMLERIYPGPCEGYEEELYQPYVVSDCGGQELEWYFDIIPNDVVNWADCDGSKTYNPLKDVMNDLDNDMDMWLSGNPNFDASDSMTIYADDIPFSMVDGVDDDGTALSDDDEALELAFAAKLSDYYLTDADGDFIWYNPVSDKWEKIMDIPATPPVTNPPGDYTDRNETTLEPICVPMLELWLATPIELAGMCAADLTICLEDLEGNSYFTIEVSDNIHTDYRIDDYIKFTKDQVVEPTYTMEYVDIDPIELVKLDSDIELDPTVKGMFNLVLIGGPVANKLVQELVDLGETTLEEWETSEGETKVYTDVYAVGKDVLVVAGADRAATAQAAVDLIDML